MMQYIAAVRIDGAQMPGIIVSVWMMGGWEGWEGWEVGVICFIA